MLNHALDIVRTLQTSGHQAVFAGGCCRDRILGLEPADYDIATSATPDQIEALFEKTIPVGKAFGVIDVLHGGFTYQVATFRCDSTYSDGRHPDSVRFSSMEEDAKRRDITINGLFWDPVADKTYDYVGGVQDLQDKVIRLIGDLHARIEEDKLRLMRVIRFAVRFGYTIHRDTMHAVIANARKLSVVSVERIFEEFTKILDTREYRKAIELLSYTGLLDAFIPEVDKMKGVDQPKDYHPEGDVLAHTILALEALPADASRELVMATLLHDIGKPATQTFEDRIRFNNHHTVGARIAKGILIRLKCSTEYIDQVVSLVENHMKFMCVQEMKIATLKRFMRLPKFEEHLALHRSDCLASHGALDNYEFMLEKFNTLEPEEIKPVRLVTGADLISLGMTPGPHFKTILEDIEDRQLEGAIKTREEAMGYIGTKHF